MSKEMMGEKQNISSFNIQAWNQKNKRGLLSGGKSSDNAPEKHPRK
jgi:hypothetical protein